MITSTGFNERKFNNERSLPGFFKHTTYRYHLKYVLTHVSVHISPNLGLL